MMRFENIWFVAAFHSTPIHDPGSEEFKCPVRVCVCKGASVLPVRPVPALRVLGLQIAYLEVN